jgi:putative ABC transport system permease protein
MDTIKQDLKYAARRLVRAPGFTAIAVLTLALGIGANAAIFSVVHGVLLKPLPYHEPDRLVSLYHLSEGQRASMSGPNFTDLKNRTQTLSGVGAFTTYRTILTGRGEPARLNAAEVTTDLFGVLGVRPALGRGFVSSDSIPGNSESVILAHGTWQQRFGGDPGVIGQSVILDGKSKQIVGVMPPGFSYPADRALWTPLEHTEGFLSSQRSAWMVSGVGRVKEGIPLEQAEAEVETIGRQLEAQYPADNEGVGLVAVPMLEALVGDVKTAVLVLLGAVGFVLLIACANVANLLLARSATREEEIAVRAALGARRSRLVRQLLTESVLLSVAGAGLGLLLAVWGVEILIGLAPASIPRLNDVRVDRVVLGFTAALAMLTGAVFGIAPALHSTRAALASNLKDGGRGAVTSRARARMRGALVIVEMAIAIVLLAGAGLLIRSFARLAAVDPGFKPDGVLAFDLALPEGSYAEEARRAVFFEQLLENLQSTAGVSAAGAALAVPLTGTNIIFSFTVEGRPPLPVAQQPAIQVRVASPDYFRVVGIPLQRGRFFNDTDRAGSTPVALITESAVREYFPGENPLGKRIVLGWRRDSGLVNGEVVGVVGDVKEGGLAEPDAPQIYLLHEQLPLPFMTVVLKTTVAPLSIADAVRSAVHALDPTLPVTNVRTLDQVVARSIAQPRFYMLLLTAFAAVALVLAAVGIFGVLSYAVAQRAREIGIRMALGARQGSVVAMVVRQAMTLSIASVVIGLCATYHVTRVLSTLLFATSRADAAALAGAAGLLLMVALAASYIPARRATRVDPVIALRSE